MAEEIRVTPTATGTGSAGAAEPSLGDLLKELAQESSTLLKQEFALAKTEMRENVRSVGKDAAMLAIGGSMLAVAALVLTAALVALLGDILGDEYWLGALIVGVLYAIIGGVLLGRARDRLKNEDLKPEATMQTLREDKRWAQDQAQQIKRELS